MADGARKVLLADDEMDVHTFVKAALGDDYECVSAMDGEQALEMVGTENPDLVILDVQMPKKNGFGVFQELRSNDATRDIPIIMLTGVAERVGMKYSGEDMGDFYGSEPDVFIDKPIEASILLATVNKLLG